LGRRGDLEMVYRCFGQNIGTSRIQMLLQILFYLPTRQRLLRR
jgi:hypothetical protein